MNTEITEYYCKSEHFALFHDSKYDEDVILIYRPSFQRYRKPDAEFTLKEQVESILNCNELWYNFLRYRYRDTMVHYNYDSTYRLYYPEQYRWHGDASNLIAVALEELFAQFNPDWHGKIRNGRSRWHPDGFYEICFDLWNTPYLREVSPFVALTRDFNKYPPLFEEEKIWEKYSYSKPTGRKAVRDVKHSITKATDADRVQVLANLLSKRF